jgi:DNA-binding PadR family transcriptional regulator
MTAALSNRQRFCLRSLNNIGPFPGGWSYGDLKTTARILEELAKSEIVTKEIRSSNRYQVAIYTINELGREILRREERANGVSSHMDYRPGR